MPVVISVDIGGTKIRSGLVDGAAAGQLRESPTPRGSDAIIENLLDEVGRLHRENPDAVAIGVASAGVVDVSSGRIVSAGPTIPGWSGTALARELGSTGLPVAVLNDVHAHALGEATHGALKGLGSGLLVAVGTGVGTAAVLGATVVTGVHGLAGTGARIEPIAAGPGMVEAYNRTASRSVRDLRAMARLLTAGDRHAHAVVHEAGFALGRWLGPQVDLLDPAAVVLCGGVAALGPAWVDAVVAGLRSAADPRLAEIPVVPATLGDRAALIGAAEWARSRCLS